MSKQQNSKFSLSDGAVRLILETAIRHVFEGNFKSKVKSIEGVSAEDMSRNDPEKMLTPFVRIGGDFQGTICMQMPRDLIQAIAMETLGFEAFKEEMFAGGHILQDASGEIVNMMAGTFKNTLSKVKMHCRLSPPELFGGEEEMVHALISAKDQWLVNLKAGEYVCQVILYTR